MSDKGNIIMTRAVSADSLEKRISKNLNGQALDLVAWIFDRINVRSGWHILELCCGTGQQTLRMVELVGANGRVVGVDTSRDALNKLMKKVPVEMHNRVTLIRTNMEKMNSALTRSKIEKESFDLLFCAYGLYYSKDPEKTLSDSLRWIRTNGKIVIVGPYGANNGSLFEFLRRSGVEIAEFVSYSSSHFMECAVVKWAVRNCRKIDIHTVRNQVSWKEPEDVMEYWKNSTFYDPLKASIVERNIHDHFRKNNEFVNEKCIMMVDIGNG